MSKRAVADFVTADHHFGHKRIIKHTNRPWKFTYQMNKALIEIWNDTVSETDRVFVLGDFAWYGANEGQKVESIVNRLRGQKILILGNHDRLKPFTYVNFGFESVHTSLFQIMPKFDLFMVHDPAVCSVVPPKTKCLCGHVHTLFKSLENTVNVGVDVWNYKPVLLETALAEITPNKD